MVNFWKKLILVFGLLIIIPTACQKTIPQGKIILIKSLILAPDSNKIAFISDWQKKPEPSDLYSVIYTMNTDGTELKQLTNQARCFGQSSELSWSSDSKGIVFDLGRKSFFGRKKGGIWIVNVDGTEQRPVIEKPFFTPVYKPQASHNNNLAFEKSYLLKETLKQRGLNRGEGELWIINLNGSNAKMITCPADKHAKKWEWFPDGERIFFVRKGNIWVIDVDTLQEKQLTIGFSIWYIDISPNGEKILFRSKIPNDELWVVNTDGSQKKQLLDSKFIATMQWSSNSKRIFFELRHPKTKKIEICSINIDTEQQIKLAEIDSDFCSQIFLPNNKGIITTRNTKTIWRMNIDGSNPHQIFPKP